MTVKHEYRIDRLSGDHETPHYSDMEREVISHDIGSSAVQYAEMGSVWPTLELSLATEAATAEQGESHEQDKEGVGLRGALERADSLAERGAELTDFSGIEVRRAIDGYYVDHEVTLYAVGSIIKGEMTPEELEVLTVAGEHDEVIKNERFKNALLKIDKVGRDGDIVKRNKLAGVLVDALYAEPCVGQMTLDEATIQRVAHEKAELALTTAQYVRPLTLDDAFGEQLRTIERAKEETQNETRHAGQLLFHNTVFGYDIGYNGSLRGREQQDTMQEETNITTLDAPTHSRNWHSSEYYDPVGYKRRKQNNTSVKRMQAKTIGVPIGVVVNRAPFGRGLEYAVVSAKEGRAVPVHEIGLEGMKAVGEIGPGGPDLMGHTSASIDRVFAVSTIDDDTRSQFDIPVGGSDIMRMDQDGVEQPIVYEIQSDSDRLANYNTMMKNPEIVSSVRASIDAGATQREILDEYGSAIAGTGAGYGHPKRVVIADLQLSTKSPASKWLHGGADVSLSGSGERGIDMDEQALRAESVIRTIQRESVNRFSGEYVVPLRAVDTKFGDSGDEAVYRKYGDKLDELLRSK